MRKALILLVVFAVVGATAFAADAPSFKWQAWVRTGFAIVSTDTGTTVAPYNYDRVGGDRIRLAFSWTSADAVVGFYSRMDIRDTGFVTSSPYTMGGFQRLYGWMSLFGGKVKIKAGITDDYTVATADWYGFGNSDVKYGLQFLFMPMDGLSIGYFQPLPTAAIDIADIYNNGILGLSYALKGIGTVALGTYMSSVTDATHGFQPYFGFNYTGVKGLTAILEGKVSLFDTTQMQFEQNLGYAMGALTAGARVGENYDGTTFYWGVEPTVSYALNKNLSVGVIANVFNNKSQTFMSPIDAGVIGGGVAGDVNFGAGASVTYTMGGARLVLGDYYSAATGAGNVLYLNVDVSF